MKKKIIVFFALAVMVMELSSCYVENGHRHWGHRHHHHHDEVIIR